MSTEMFGAYRVLHKIGKGGMADVFLAEDPAIRRQVAIKVLPHEFLRDETFIKRFEREVHTIAALQHPAILPVYAYGQQEGQPYIAMAYMSGGSLADEIRANPGGLSYERIQRLVERIAEGLDYAHKRGIIHRDFKPSNVLLDDEGNPYIADFGIAKATADTAQLTGSGIVGTPAYMAPEMATSGGVGPGVDVYALGVALYQMLTGQMPFTADTPMGVLMAHATAPIPDPSPLRADLPRGVVQVLYASLAKSPAQRYQSAGELARDLRAALSGQEIQRPMPVQTLIESGTWEMERPAATQPAPARSAPKTIGVTAQMTVGETGQPAAAAPRRGGFPVVPLILGLLLIAALVIGGIFVLPGLLNPPEATLPAAAVQPTTVESVGGFGLDPTYDAAVQATADARAALAASAPDFKAALLVDNDSDSLFSIGSMQGFQNAVDEYGISGDPKIAPSAADYQPILDSLSTGDYDLVFAVGFTMADALASSAAAHPDQHYAIIDYSYDPPLENVTGVTFETGEAAFLAGYLAAGVTETGFVATYGGMDLPPVRVFMDYFEAGVNYYNEQKLAGIQVYGQDQFIGDFVDEEASYRIAADLINVEGADVIMPVAGTASFGAVPAAREQGALIIGVDYDWCRFRPESCDVVLTTVQKDMSSAITDLIRLALLDQLEPGVYTGNLANGGVSLAPYRDQAGRVSPELQAELDALSEQLIRRRINYTLYLPAP